MTSITDREKLRDAEITPNATLLLKTLEWIETHPEELQQDSWRCGTAACYAGHAVVIDGGQWAPWDGTLLARAEDPEDYVFRVDAGWFIHIAHRARHVLGLTADQADRLFSGNNTLDDLRAEVYRLVGDWDALAEHTEAAAIRSINGRVILPSAYGDPALSLEEKHLRWDDLKDAIRDWQAADAGGVDPASLEPDWRDPETYANHCRGLVDDAVHKLIGRTA